MINRSILIFFSLISIFVTVYSYKTVLVVLTVLGNLKLFDISSYFIFTSISELFIIYFKLSYFFTGQFFYLFLFYHSISFLGPGLFKIEYFYLKRLLKYYFFCWLIFLGGFNLFVLPFFSDFFVFNNYQQNSFYNLKFYFEPEINKYLIFVKNIFNNFWGNLQFFIVIIFIVNFFTKYTSSLKSTRRFLYVVILCFSTITTPPDILSQILMFLILTLVFELSILVNLLKFITKKLIR